MIETSLAASEALQKTLVESETDVSARTRRFVESYDSAALATAGLTERLKGVTDQVIAQIATLQSMSNEANKDLRMHSESVRNMKTMIENEIQIAKAHSAVMGQILIDSEGSVKALQHALVSLSKTLVEELSARQ